MIRKPWIGILAAGPMSPALFRIADLHVHLGPVASASLRVASRLANRLKAGAAVPPEGLQTADFILITGPDADFPELLDLATSNAIDWRGKTAVLLDFQRDTGDLAPLRALGASTGTLDCLDAFSDCRFVADAEAGAKRRLRRFAKATKSSIFYLLPGEKKTFTAAAACTGVLFSPLVAASVDGLKKAGLTQAEAVLIAERNALHTLRAGIKTGRKERDFDAFKLDFAAKNGKNDALLTTGRLAANLAHDWNNLLTLLAGQAAEISLALPPDHPAQTATADLHSAIDHAADSPRRLLAWLRDEASDSTPFDLNDAIRAAVPLVQLALGRGVTCVTNLCAEPMQLPLDQPHFLNALLNLASNAATAMSGRGQFTITTNGKTLILEDSGAGMNEETRNRIFEPFFSTGSANGGTGLGMETVKSFAAAHKATISIDSAPSQGCRFTLRFGNDL